MAKWNIDVPQSEYFGPLPYNPKGIVAGDLHQLVHELTYVKEIAIDTETTGLSKWGAQVLYWSLAWGKRRCTLHSSLLPYFRNIFSDSSKIWILANAKFDAHMLMNTGGNYLAGELHCTQVMHSLLFEGQSHRLKDMAQHLLGWRWSDFQDTFGRITKNFSPFELIRKAEAENFPLLVEYAANDAWGTLGCYLDLRDRLASAYTHSLFRHEPPYIDTLWDLFYKVEAPYTKVLWKNERNGILIDQARMALIAPIARAEIEQLERDISRDANLGRPINPNSGTDLADYFFGLKKYDALKMTTGGKSGIRKPSIDKGFLEHIAELHNDPVAKMLLEHRNLVKLEGTYIQGLSDLMDPTGRIHTQFNQDIARTGRLSCVAEWTPIKTPRGLIPIKEVEAGDYVWTHEGRWRKVLRSFTKGPGYMFDLHLSNGEVLTCTTDHRLLGSDGQWLPVGDLIDEHLERLGRERAESEASAGTVPLVGSTHDGADCREAGDHIPQCLPRAEEAHAGEGTEDSRQAAVLGLEDRHEESHEGEERRAAPQLEGRVPGQRWLPDQAGGRSPAASPQAAPRQDPQVEGTPRPPSCTPHRRRQNEQSPRQSGGSDKSGAQAHPLYAGRGLEAVTITRVNYRGCLEVHDVTVEEDESYFACGICSHNSADPNLQNIPNVDKDKWKLRGAFIAGPGNLFVVADYSQLEMRLLACASLQPEMIQIFFEGKDIHMGNASMMMGTPYDDLVLAKDIDKQVKQGKLPDSAMTRYVLECLANRAAAKNIGFGLNYGMGPGKLALDLGVSKMEAIAKIELYKKTYPAVTAFYREAIEETERTGYAFTILGRRRNVPGILSHRNDERAQAERIAVNTQIQGSAADVVKMAQINLDRARLDLHFSCHSLLQVHDELVHECPAELAQLVKKEVKSWMEMPFFRELAVPLTVDASIGPSWLLAK